MAVAQLNSTTLTNQITTSDNVNIAVGSTSNISAGNLLAVAGKGGLEIMKVQSVPVSGQVNVMRGWAGTRARTQAAGTTLYIGTPDIFKQHRENAAALVGDSSFLPDYCLPGTRARDGVGNEYVLVDLQGTYYSGTTVLIDSAHDGTYFGTVLAGGNQGAVGVLVEEGTSNQYAWAQVFGYCAFAQETIADSAGTSTNWAFAATTPSTPSVGMAAAAQSSAGQYNIEGMFIVGAATTATTSATSSTGVAYPVWLNYPFVRQAVISLTT